MLLTLTTKLGISTEDTQLLINVFCAPDDTLFYALSQELRDCFNAHYDDLELFVVLSGLWN